MKKYLKSLDFYLLTITILISVVSLYVSYTSGQKNLADYDAIARLNIARKIFDSLTPGVAQLGGIWLPFPQVLFIPFIMNDFLWHTGLAGAFGSMASFILGSLFLYKTVYTITNRKKAGFLAWLIYVTNVNILLLQSMAMSESFFLFTLIMVIYFLTKWAKTRNIIDLTLTGFFVILITLTRYEGYAIFGAASLSVAVVILATYGKSNFKRLEGLLILFMTLAGFGIFIWSFYSFLIFKDPIYWLNLYSGNKQVIALDPTEVTQVLKNVTTVSAKASAFESFKIYGSAMAFINGVLLSLLAALGFIFLMIKEVLGFLKKELNILILPTLIITLCIFTFLIVGYHMRFIPNIETPRLTLATILNQANNFASSSNIRYGIIILPLISLVLGLVYSKTRFLSAIVLIFLGVQIYSLVYPPLFLTFSLPKKSNYQISNASKWMIANYDTGLILTSANRHENFIFQTKLPYKDFIYEGSQDIWKESLKDPTKHARWVVLDTVDDGDAVNTFIKDKSILYTKYDTVFNESNLLIFKLK